MKRERLRRNSKEISWNRVRSIFNFPRPPQFIWEQHFDHDQVGFEKFARTPYEEMDFRELAYYHANLAYQELQPEVFAYLFPVCLMDWHETLMNDQPCFHATVGFHEALAHGHVLERMLTDHQRELVFEFFQDSFRAKLETQRGLVSWTHLKKMSRQDFLNLVYKYAAIHRFNSLGKLLPDIEPLWEILWGMTSPGAAVVAGRYCFDLIYEVGKISTNWNSPELSSEYDTGVQFIGENDSEIYGRGWLPENLHFLSEQLTLKFLESKLEQAAEVLRGEPEEATLLEMQQELKLNPEVAAINIESLITRLQTIE